METQDIIYTLRNPYGCGWVPPDIEATMLAAAEEIERWKGAFENMRDFVENNGETPVACDDLIRWDEYATS